MYYLEDKPKNFDVFLELLRKAHEEIELEEQKGNPIVLKNTTNTFWELQLPAIFDCEGYQLSAYSERDINANLIASGFKFLNKKGEN